MRDRLKGFSAPSWWDRLVWTRRRGWADWGSVVQTTVPSHPKTKWIKTASGQEDQKWPTNHLDCSQISTIIIHGQSESGQLRQGSRPSLSICNLGNCSIVFPWGWTGLVWATVGNVYAAHWSPRSPINLSMSLRNKRKKEVEALVFILLFVQQFPSSPAELLTKLLP